MLILAKLTRLCDISVMSVERNGRSHFYYTKQGFTPISIPKHKPLKPVYVDSVIEAYEIFKKGR